jgi:hypothetical protein
MGDLPKSLQPWLVGLIFFSSVDPVSKVVVSNNAFDIVLFKKQNCEVWKKVGAAHLTQACLLNQKQARQEMSDIKDTANNTI